MTATLAKAGLESRVRDFIETHVIPAEARYDEQLAGAADRWRDPPVMTELRARAKAEGLWNLFLPDAEHGAGLTNREYAPLCEAMGRSPIAPQVFNCNAPDTGNMEVLAGYGTRAQQERWLRPLLAGEIHSGFSMTEPGVASSDATNIAATIVRDGDELVLNGRKWWTTMACHRECKLLIFMGRSDPDAPRHQQHTMVLVPIDTPGVNVIRPLIIAGYDDAPVGHAEIHFDRVRVPAENVILGEGRGFEVAQGRLGPGRLHHCLRLIGLAERTLAELCARAKSRTTFGKTLADQGVIREWIAESRIEIDMVRLLVYRAAEILDASGNKVAKTILAEAKVAAPRMALRVIDRAIQTFGAAGLEEAAGLAAAWTKARSLRLADGPDEVHLAAIAKAELTR